MNKPKWLSDYKEPKNEKELHFGASNDAGVLVHKNSGFRTFMPIIKTEDCIKCLFCWIYCPEGCVDKSGDVVAIDYDYCKGCGICAKECPKKCIDMVKEADKNG